MRPRSRNPFLLLAAVVVCGNVLRFDGYDVHVLGTRHRRTSLVAAAIDVDADEPTPDTDKEVVGPPSGKSNKHVGAAGDGDISICEAVQVTESASPTRSSISASPTASSVVDRLLQRFLSLGRIAGTRGTDLATSRETSRLQDQKRQKQRQQRQQQCPKSGFGLPSSQSQASSSLQGGLYNFRRRFARACAGDEECEKQAEREGKDFDAMAATSRHPDAFPGMVLQIFKRTEGASSFPHVDRNDDAADDDADDDANDQNGDAGWLEISHQESQDGVGHAGIDYDGQTEAQCDIYGDGSDTGPASFLFERAYVLEEPLLLELGVVPKHYLDFVYTPVVTREWQEDVADDTTNNGADVLDGIDDHTQTDRHRTRSSSSKSDSINLKDQQPAPAIQEDSMHGTHQPKDASSVQVVEPSANVLAPSSTDYASPFSSWWSWWLPYTSSWWRPHGSTNTDYDMGKSAFAGGSNGEVWRGRRICTKPTFFSRHTEDLDCDDKQPLILKRLRVERGYRLLEAGLREVYFGNVIRKQIDEERQNMFTVYVDHFFREVPRAFGRVQTKDLELWIVFKDAGPSLRSYMYTAIVSGGFMMYQQSKLWTQLRTFTQKVSHHVEDDTSLVILNENAKKARRIDRTSKEKPKSKIPLIGRNIMRDILHQILSAAAALHEKGIIHRDIKPSNVMCTTDVPFDDLHELKRAPTIQCRLGDLSSGWDPYTAGHLYTEGPSPGEQTDEYAPPESFVGRNWVAFDKNKPQSYDSWSIGVTALELLLGSPNVFSVDQRTNALLTNKMKKAGASEEDISHALYLAALSNFCIYVPSTNPSKTQSWPLRYGDPLHKITMVKESCTLQDFHRALTARDPLGLGFSGSDLLLHLIWQLLSWDPEERMTAEEALHHPYFTSPDETLESVNLVSGIQNALESQMLDPRMDFKIEDDVQDFVCPKCGRTFNDWKSCHQHSNLRKHAKFCTYDRSNLPSCMNAHSMLPAHPTSGYCDLQGRRPTIEDFHSIHLHHDHQFYGIFDGHAGNLASKFVAGALYETLIRYLPNINQHHNGLSPDDSHQVKTAAHTWKEDIHNNVTKAFEDLHDRFLEMLSTMPAPMVGAGSAPNTDQSGTTATALLVTEYVIVVAGLGDSRAVLSSSKGIISESGSGWRDFPSVSAIQLTVDHVASDPAELALVIERGGSVRTRKGGLPRVNGTLAITRSIGDEILSPILSREPYILSLDREELRDRCGSLGSINGGWMDNETAGVSQIPCFVVLASDGLWDVMSNQEAVDMVVDVILQERVMIFNDTDLSGRSAGGGGVFQEAAERLALEAYVRGSSDNIGVCVVAVN